MIFLAHGVTDEIYYSKYSEVGDIAAANKPFVFIEDTLFTHKSKINF